MNTKVIKNNHATFLFSSIIFSFSLIQLSAGLQILRPSETNWLSVGDGTSEISWEFFRNQQLLQFPLGKNPNYGLEISSTIAFDGQIPFISLILKVFNFLLTERFQYFGLFLFMSFILNFYSSCKVFTLFNFKLNQIILNATILSLSPVILNRFIDNTHYALVSVWLIFFAIYLLLSNKHYFYSWIILFNFAVLIHFYFIPFLVIIYTLKCTNEIVNNKIKFIKFTFETIAVTFFTLITMFIIGYFYNISSSQDVGYGVYRATLSSLLDPSGWSSLIPDLGEPSGSYEGFSFVGISSIILLIVYLIILKVKVKTKIDGLDFKYLWIAAILLFVFSLSNKISLGNTQIFEFRVPKQIEFVTNSFRSTGRFSWLIVFTIFIYLTYKISQKLSKKHYSFLLLVLLILNIADAYSQLVSQKNVKFNLVYKSKLVDSSWNYIGNCYEKIRFFPPVASIDNLYDFLVLANSQNLGINSARLARFNQNVQAEEFKKIQNQIEKGIYDTDSFYIFNSSPFVDSNFINLYKEVSIRTLKQNDAWGLIDKYYFIAPEIKSCESSGELLKNVENYGTEKKFLYDGEILNFGINKNNDKYSLIGFSDLYDEGVLANTKNSRIVLHVNDGFSPKKINIQGTSLDENQKSSMVLVKINNTITKTCLFKNAPTVCIFNIGKRLSNDIIEIRFETSDLSESNQFGLNSLILVN